MTDSGGDLGDLMPLGAKLIEVFFAFEESLGGGGAEGDDGFGTDDVDFGEDEGAGELNFFWASGSVVAGLARESGTEFTEIGEVNLFAG